ncbi:MAG TPA: VWA domain-containing protein [Polyangiaceae bacterium]|nr:VWA domain-containing protein [Polyangiaceae bacterium]
MPFELRTPSGLWLLGLLGPLLLLYVLRIRRQRLRVPSTWLWAAAERDLLARHPFRRLRAEVPLLLEALAIILLSLALAQPVSRASHLQAGNVALVIDTSASMGARGEGGKTRMQAAQRAALAVLSSLAPGAAVMVIDAGREPQIVAPLERDRQRLERVILRLEAHEVEGALGRSLAVASDHLRSRPGSNRIVVITDGAVVDDDALNHSSLPVEVIRVGEPVDNTAIVRVDATMAPDAVSRREQVQVFGVVTNFGKQPRQLFVTLTQRNVQEPLASRKLELAAGEQAPFVLSFDAAPGDAGSGLTVQLSPPDALPADDRAFLRVPASHRLPVVLVPADSSPWLTRALAADPGVETMGATPAALATGDVPNDAFVIVVGSCPAVIPGGDFAIINPPPGDCHGTLVADPVQRPMITSWVESDPRLRFLNLEGIDILHARRLEPDSPRGALVRAREGALVADVSAVGRTGTLIGFDPGETSWPLKASFVLFVRNLTELGRAHRAGMASGPARTGEPLRVRVPPQVTEAEVEGPDGNRLKLPARAGLVVAPGVDRAGFYFLTYQGGSTLLPANLTSAPESDVRPRLSPGTVAARARSDKAPEAVSGWSWLRSALALLLLAVDLWWVTRAPRKPTSGLLPVRPERAAP